MAAAGIGIETFYRHVLKFENVLRKADRATGRVQKRSGGMLRTIWRRSIRYRKKTNSAPGALPFTHVKSGAFGLRMILWDYDPRSRETIVGPVGGADNSGVPEALEKQGRTRIKLPTRVRRKLGKKYVSAVIRKRPSAGRALSKFATKQPELWKGSIV